MSRFTAGHVPTLRAALRDARAAGLITDRSGGEVRVWWPDKSHHVTVNGRRKDASRELLVFIAAWTKRKQEESK